MSMVRGLGRRERVARNRHRRCVVFTSNGSVSGTFKLGRKKHLPSLFRSHLTSGSTSRDDREVAPDVRVVETEKQEPACAGAPVVGPE